MSNLDLILIGAGGHALACIDVIEQQGRYKIVGLAGFPEELKSYCLGYEVIATDDKLAMLVKEIPCALISAGQIQSAKLRINLYQQAKRLGFQLPPIIAPTAYVSRHANIGEGTIVMHGAIVHAGAKVGNNCIINSQALIEHNAIVEDHCHISTGAILNGSVIVREGSFVGSGCVVKQGISIGKSCVVGIGLTVRQSIADSSQLISNVKL
jgi:sugar O-acyltransferase (sialic acid O-acetyltransferase NeuD family)